jgi:hypothetical protein
MFVLNNLFAYQEPIMSAKPFSLGLLLSGSGIRLFSSFFLAAILN